MAVASWMRVFRACPVPGGRRLAGLPRIEISQSLEGQNSLVVGKNAGNFVESALFCENPSRKHLRIQSFADEFPTRARREFFRCAGNEQGIPRETQSARATHPMASKCLSLANKKIINRRFMLRLRTNTLCLFGRARAGCAAMQINRGRIP